MEREISEYILPEMAQMRSQDPDKYYSETLPTLYTEVLMEKAQEPFDVLIIDEAQDVIDSHYLETLDIMIPGGLQNGNWYFFMDADKQSLVFLVLRWLLASFLRNWCQQVLLLQVL